jgi:hypothetical protein
MKRDVEKAIQYVRDTFGRFTSKVIQQKSQIVFKSKKKKLLNRLMRHPISQELMSKSPSNLLGGLGTLYGFMGFDVSRQPNPVQYLYDYLDQNIKPKYKQERGGFTMQVRLEIPSYEEMRKDSNLILEWEGGLAWPEAIEVGLSGLGYFLRSGRKNKGRSLLGLQSETLLRPEQMIQASYLTEIYQNDSDFRS